MPAANLSGRINAVFLFRAVLRDDAVRRRCSGGRAPLAFDLCVSLGLRRDDFGPFPVLLGDESLDEVYERDEGGVAVVGLRASEKLESETLQRLTSRPVFDPVLLVLIEREEAADDRDDDPRSPDRDLKPDVKGVARIRDESGEEGDARREQDFDDA
jgi:hypothetical protein